MVQGNASEKVTPFVESGVRNAKHGDFTLRKSGVFGFPEEAENLRKNQKCVFYWFPPRDV